MAYHYTGVALLPTCVYTVHKQPDELRTTTGRADYPFPFRLNAMNTTTATETTTFYFDLDASCSLEFQAPVGTDPQTIIDAVQGQLCIDNRLDLPEGVSLGCSDVDSSRIDFVEQD